MIDLEHALTDLANHLDHPAGDALPNVVRARLTAPAPLVPRSRARTRVLSVAAAIVVILATLLAVAPTRSAIADWLGIGAVSIRQTDEPSQAGTTSGDEVPGAPGSEVDPDVQAALQRARSSVGFPIALAPDGAGPLRAVEVDARPIGGLVALSYDDFTLVEVASAPGERPPLGKLIGPDTRIEDETVNGRPGRWITGPHDIGYIDRADDFRIDTVRRAGPTLIWEDAGITYRIEGVPVRDDAVEIATGLR